MYNMKHDFGRVIEHRLSSCLVSPNNKSFKPRWRSPLNNELPSQHSWYYWRVVFNSTFMTMNGNLPKKSCLLWSWWFVDVMLSTIYLSKFASWVEANRMTLSPELIFSLLLFLSFYLNFLFAKTSRDVHFVWIFHQLDQGIAFISFVLRCRLYNWSPFLTTLWRRLKEGVSSEYLEMFHDSFSLQASENGWETFDRD